MTLLVSADLDRRLALSTVAFGMQALANDIPLSIARRYAYVQHRAYIREWADEDGGMREAGVQLNRWF